jgi:uncharacterized protein DUF6221
VTAELTRFLNDRYDERESLADDATSEAPRLTWQPDKVYDGVFSLDLGPATHADADSYGVGEDIRLPRELAMHIAAHAPAAVLTELASKRRIVNLLSPTWVSHCLDDCDICTVGRELAEPFADVDGWREDWRPVREGELLT